MIVVSMTSWVKRIGFVKSVVESIMKNTVTPDRVYLNLSKTEFDNAGVRLPDDLLDYLGDEKKLGKPVGSDQKNDKHTYVSLVGIENAKSDVVSYSNKAIKALDVFGEKSKEQD